MDDTAVLRLFDPLYADFRPEDAFHIKKPLLAHYTTIPVLEKILTTNEIWFSNPLFMNDIEEVRFGVLQGNSLVMGSKQIAIACKTVERAQKFEQSFASFFNQFANQNVLNTYVFCMSEHDKDDNDGLLSMWRGYGANGNGVAIVFDVTQINVLPTSPLIIAAVNYDTTEARMAWLQKLLTTFAKILHEASVPDEKLYICAHALFERIKLFALFTKHRGFKEEREWRVVYMPDRDPQKKGESMFHYAIGHRGVEPKMRFKIGYIEGLTAPDLSLAKITERIILGPTISSPIANATVSRMFDLLGQTELKAKLRASTIPLRSIA
jgi:hypothetical protein